MLLIVGFSGCTVSLDTAFLCSSLQQFVANWPSKVPASPPATRAAAPKSAKASPAAAIIIAATASTKATSAAAHQVSQQEEDQPGVACLHQEEEDQQNDAAAQNDLSQAQLNGSLLAMVLVDWLSQIQGNARVGSNRLGDLPNA